MSTKPRTTEQSVEDCTTSNLTSQSRAPERLWSRTFITIVALTLCCFLVGQGTNAGTSVYLDRMGETATLAGIGAAVFSAAAAVSRLLCGPIIDRKGRAIVMATGAAIMLAGTAGPVFANTSELFVVWRFLQGMGFAIATTASATAAADVLPLSRLGEGIGYYGLGQAIAMSIGPALALFLVSTDPAENLYLGFSAAATAAVAFALTCRYEKNPRSLPKTSAYRRRWEREQASSESNAANAADGAFSEKGAPASTRTDTGMVADAACNTQTGKAASSADAASLENPDHHGGRLRSLVDGVLEPRALPGTIPMMIMSPAFGFGIFFVGLYGTSLGVGNAGVFYTISAIAMIAVRLKSKSFMDTVAPIKIMGVSAASGLICYGMLLVCGIWSNFGALDIVFYFAGIFYGLCLGLAMPVNQTVAVRNTPDERWGAANALYLLATDIGIGTASVIWGVINDSFGFTTTICCVMACIAASLIAARVCYPRDKA